MEKPRISLAYDTTARPGIRELGHLISISVQGASSGEVFLASIVGFTTRAGPEQHLDFGPTQAEPTRTPRDCR